MKPTLTSLSVLLCLILAGGALGQTRQDNGQFKVMGIGGAGGMYVPTVSPYDPKLMFIACDMSGTYHSTDGGKTWAMYHWSQLSSSRASRPAFSRDAIYWATDNTLKISKDKGATWQPVVQGEQPWKNEELTRIALVGDNGSQLLLTGTSNGIYASADGKSWNKVREGKVNDMQSANGAVYAALADEVVTSADGKTWNKIDIKMPDNKPVFTITGAAKGNEKLLFAANKSAILKSADQGKTWQVVNDKSKCDVVLMPQGQTQTVWAAQDHGQEVYVSHDGGKSWNSVFRMNGDNANVERSWVQTQLKWGYYISPLGLGIDPADPKVAMVSTQGDFYITRDGGKSWQQLMNNPVGKKGSDPGFRYACNGLEVTSCWQFLFDPNDDQKVYIAYTDIGFARSVDRGQTWISSTEGCPWSNTFYQVEFDPQVKGKLYAACSSRHDIPHWTHIDANNASHKGGVCVSDNYGQSWTVLGKGLPNLPCTSIALDPKTQSPNLTLYVTLFEGGVFKSTDNGQTWQKKSNGLGNEGNNHAFMVKVHPKTGTLFCSITAFRKAQTFAVPGGLWKSTDGGENWTDISKQLDLRWATGFAVDPNDENIIYLAAATAPQFNQGGMYKTTDGGKTWKQMINDAEIAKSGPPGYSQEMFVTLHPDHPDWVYLSSGSHGLWLSKDSGATWKHFDAIPFRSITRLAWDPNDHNQLYVTTFGGGVWKGPAEP